MGRRNVNIALVAMGTTWVIAQVLLVRELMVAFHGNELIVGLALAGWLLASALGSAFAGRWADRSGAPLSVFLSIQTFLAVALPAAVLGGRTLRPFLGLLPGELVSPGTMVAISALVLVPLLPGLEMQIRRACFRAWGKGILAIIRARVKVEGQPPAAPFFMVTNHLTNLDVVLLSSVLGCVFVSRADIAHWPVVGPIVRHMGTIFIDRSNIRDTKRVNVQIAEAMAKGHGVLMFAESRVSQDAQVHPFKAPLLEPAVQMHLPVHHGALSYCAPEGWPTAADAIIWKEGVSFGQNISQILSMPHVYATLTFGADPISGGDRKKLAEELYRAVSQEFTPVDTLPETPES